MLSFPIISKLGGEEAALAILKARTGKQPTGEALRKWRTHGVVPAWAQAGWLMECQKRRIVCKPSDFKSTKSEVDA